MIRLGAGGWAAALLPERGAAFQSLTWQGRDVLAPIPEGADPNAGFHGAFLMAPWTNRLQGGRIAVGGVEYRMPINRPHEGPKGGNALHGFLRDQAWRVEAQDDAAATFAVSASLAPFHCAARMMVSLTEAGVSLAVTLENTGDAPVPMGFGWHPWFARPEGTHLCFAASTVFGRDALNIADDPRPGPGLYGAGAVLDGHDTHFAGWDGQAAITWPDGTRFALRAAGAWAGNLQVFAPTGGGVLCVEPVTHAPDAANRPGNAAHGPMHLLAPGETLSAALTLHLA